MGHPVVHHTFDEHSINDILVSIFDFVQFSEKYFIKHFLRCYCLLMLIGYYRETSMGCFSSLHVIIMFT